MYHLSMDKMRVFGVKPPGPAGVAILIRATKLQRFGKTLSGHQKDRTVTFCYNRVVNYLFKHVETSKDLLFGLTVL